MSILISEASIEQLSVVRSLAHKIWPPTFGSILSLAQISYMLEMMYSLPSLEKQATTESNIFLLAKDGSSDSYAGFASYELNYKGTQSCKLHKIYILPEMQGKQIGRSLMNAVEQAAIQHRQYSLLLNVNRYNNAAEFYKNYGFNLLAEEDIDIGGGYFMNDFVMELILPVA